jgi:hypothetical protein
MALLISGRRPYALADVRKAEALLERALQEYDALIGKTAEPEDWDFLWDEKMEAARFIDDAEETLGWVRDRYRYGFPEVLGVTSPAIPPGVGLPR